MHIHGIYYSILVDNILYTFCGINLNVFLFKQKKIVKEFKLNYKHEYGLHS